MKETLDYYVHNVYPGQRTPGEMSESRLGQLLDFYVKEGVIARPIAMKSVYTNEFVLR